MLVSNKNKTMKTNKEKFELIYEQVGIIDKSKLAEIKGGSETPGCATVNIGISALINMCSDFTVGKAQIRPSPPN
jgi:hypothetical protein